MSEDRYIMNIKIKCKECDAILTSQQVDASDDYEFTCSTCGFDVVCTFKYEIKEVEEGKNQYFLISKAA